MVDNKIIIAALAGLAAFIYLFKNQGSNIPVEPDYPVVTPVIPNPYVPGSGCQCSDTEGNCIPCEQAKPILPTVYCDTSLPVDYPVPGNCDAWFDQQGCVNKYGSFGNCNPATMSLSELMQCLGYEPGICGEGGSCGWTWPVEPSDCAVKRIQYDYCQQGKVYNAVTKNWFTYQDCMM